MSLKENEEVDLLLSSFFLILPPSAVTIIRLFLFLMKDKIRYCPIPYAITEMIINSVILVSEADDCVPRRSEILSSAVSTTNTAVAMTAMIKMPLLPTFGDNDCIFMMKTPASQLPLSDESPL
jgi:hypothetical protein